MSGAYKAVKGKLKFKGDSKKSSSSAAREPQANPAVSLASASSAAAGASADRDGDSTEVVIRSGAGRITSSGTTVQGHGTEFMSQLAVGDAIIITHPSTLREETKVVRMVLSNVSIGISSAFSGDLVSTTAFKYIKAPKDETNEEDKARSETLKAHKMEEAAFGTYASEGGTKLTYRVKSSTAFGGYKIVTETTSSAMSREQLLEMRAKKKSDRFCY